ncbi:MAG: hypothetical protein ACXWPM_09120 [Bdellovibrionota bacterium]
MFKFSSVLLAIIVSHYALASVPGAQSLECHDLKSENIRVSADIWLMGHPQGGLTSFGGVMKVDGHIFQVGTDLNPATFSGSTEDLARLDYRLVLGELLHAPLNSDEHSELQSREQSNGPSPAGPWNRVPMICRWVK